MAGGTKQNRNEGGKMETGGRRRAWGKGEGGKEQGQARLEEGGWCTALQPHPVLRYRHASLQAALAAPCTHSRTSFPNRESSR